MPLPGLSLMGFMNEKDAIACINRKYVVDDGTDRDFLKSLWADAKNKVEAHTFPAGTSEILDMTRTAQNYLDALLQEDHVKFFMYRYFTGWEFKMVEIDPLIAVQSEILLKPGKRYENLGELEIDEEKALEICLPKAFLKDRYNWHSSNNSIFMRSQGTELNILDYGFFGGGNEYAGIMFGNRIPFVQVVVHEGRTYMFNGNHRAYLLRKAGLTHIPCILKPSSQDISEAGANTDGSTFMPEVVLRENAPTIAHFVKGLAAEVMMKKRVTYISLNWSKHTVYEE